MVLALVGIDSSTGVLCECHTAPKLNRIYGRPTMLQLHNLIVYIVSVCVVWIPRAWLGVFILFVVPVT
eukprot:COSAG02_NODE_2708_length_8189_cov_3.908282_7_plen_68_part_00